MIHLFWNAVLFTLVATSITGCKVNNPPAAEFPAINNVQWVVPGSGLPTEIKPQESNNCLAIHLYHDRLYMAFRSAPSHFASKKPVLYVMSSPDLGQTWTYENQVSMQTDIREPSFLVMNDQLILNFVELGSNPLTFTPQKVWQMIKTESAGWAAPQVAPDLPLEIMPWEVKERNGVAYMSSYIGSHYSTSNDSKIDVYFKKSEDGIHWQDVNPAHPIMYEGGVSEVGYEFDAAGNFFAVTRNEDGDASGFGSHVVFGSADSIGSWEFPAKSNPFRFDSPHMFRHGDDIYLIARRSIKYMDPSDDTAFVTWPYDNGLSTAISIGLRRIANLTEYSLLPKRTALYKIDQKLRTVVWQKDLPSAGDTSFPSIVQLSADRFLIANYSNPIIKEGITNTIRWPWIEGQLSQTHGTQIYLATLDFPPGKAPKDQ